MKIDILAISTDSYYTKCKPKGVPQTQYLYNYVVVLYKMIMRVVSFLDPDDRVNVAYELLQGSVDYIRMLSSMTIEDRYQKLREWSWALEGFREGDDMLNMPDNTLSNEQLCKRLYNLYHLNKIKDLSMAQIKELADKYKNGITHNDHMYDMTHYIEMKYNLPYRNIHWEKYSSLKQLELPAEFYDHSPVDLPFTLISEIDKKEYVFQQKTTEINVVLRHIAKRFDELDLILTHRNKAVVLFPGADADNHSLGTGIAAGVWSSKTDHSRMVQYIATRIKKLQQKFGNRVRFGVIGFARLLAKTPYFKGHTQDPSLDYIHVWGANSGNWNTMNGTSQSPLGAAQASVIYQDPGVFGIVTMPTTDTSILSTDVNLMSYFG